MPEEPSAYQKASRGYMRIMAMIVLILCAAFMYRIYADGEAFNPFFILLAIVSVVCLSTLFRAPEIAARLPKEYQNKERRSWDFRTGYVVFASFVMFFVIFYIAKSFSLDMKLALIPAWFFLCFSFFYYGLDAYRHGILYGREFFGITPQFVARGDKAKKLGIILMWASIIAFICLFIIILLSP